MWRYKICDQQYRQATSPSNRLFKQAYNPVFSLGHNVLKVSHDHYNNGGWHQIFELKRDNCKQQKVRMACQYHGPHQFGSALSSASCFWAITSSDWALTSMALVWTSWTDSSSARRWLRFASCCARTSASLASRSSSSFMATRAELLGEFCGAKGTRGRWVVFRFE